MLRNDCLQTPSYITQSLGPFDLDPCSAENSFIADVNWSINRGENGLENDWFGFVWCNPPFSQKQLWVNKMISHKNGILLLPERGSAPWFGPLAAQAGKYFVFGKKINFIGGLSSNNVGSVLFLFGETALQRVRHSDLPGHLVSVEWYKCRS